MEYNKIKLDNKKTLSFYNIPNQSIIETYFKNNDVGFTIFFKAFTGITKTLYVQSYYKVAYLKEMIKLKQGIPMDEQILVFNGVALEDNRTIEDYNIWKECHISIFLR